MSFSLFWYIVCHYKANVTDGGRVGATVGPNVGLSVGAGDG